MNLTLVSGLAVLMMVVGAGFIYLVVRENDRPLPKGGVQWVAVGLSLSLVLFSSFLLALSLIPAPIDAFGPDPLPAEMDAPAPDFRFKRVDDNDTRNLSELAGNVVLLNIWATWCAPCLAELPDLNRLQDTYRDRGLVVVTLSDEPRGELLAFQDSMPLRTVSAYVADAESLPQPFRRTVVSQVRPATYIIDREGYLRVFFTGAGDYAFFEQVLRTYLDGPVAAR